VTKEQRLRALENQVRRLQRCVEHYQATSYRYSWLRFVVFFAGLLAAGLTFFFVGAWLSAICLVVGGLFFVLSVYLHGQVNEAIRRCQLWLQVKAAHIARAQLDWERIPARYHHQPEQDHPFEADLDLVGQRSLHGLLDTAVSYEGSQRLWELLRAPIPNLEWMRWRQQLVRELVPMHLFRDRLAVNAALGAGATRTWKASQLVDWLERHGAAASLRSWFVLLGAMAGLNAILFVANRMGLIPPWWQVSVAIYLGLWLVRSRAANAAWDEAMALEGSLRQLRVVFYQLESLSYRNRPGLRDLCEPFLDRDHRPSRYLVHITRVLAAMSLRENPLLRFLLNAVVPWDAYFVWRLNQIKAGMAKHARTWMEAWFELEALSSLANFAYLNPGYTFPDVQIAQPREGEPLFRAEALGHPLLPEENKVCNDLEISRMGQVTIVTGSNMAGKSVFLKTVAMNVALACAGGPVNARQLETVPFRLFTSMRIGESVTDGISYFYGEVRRLKALLAELEREHPLPLLFCIDEIFRGTNNRERLIGSRAYVRAVAGKNGLGFIATHDLELTKLAVEVPLVVNYHFRDDIAGHRMVFDYTLRPGPCPTTNALKIMEMEGLPVQGGYGDATVPADGLL
jgi:hypothetical protein